MIINIVKKAETLLLLLVLTLISVPATEKISAINIADEFSNSVMQLEPETRNPGLIPKIFSPWLRNRHSIYLNCNEKERIYIPIKLKIIKSLDYKVVSPSGERIAQGTASQNYPMKFRATKSGTYLLEIDPGNGAFQIQLPRPFVLADKCHLLGEPAELYLSTNRKNNFKLYLSGGGKKELAAIKIFNSKGETIFNDELTPNKNSISVELPVDKYETDKTWKIKISKASTGVFDDVILNFPDQIATFSPQNLLVENKGYITSQKKKYIKVITDAINEIKSFKASPPYAEAWKKQFLIHAESMKKSLDNSDDFYSLKRECYKINSIQPATSALLSNKLNNSDIAVIQSTVISNSRILDDNIFPPGNISQTLNATGAGNQFVPISFFLISLKDIKDIKLSYSQLTSSQSNIPKGNISCRVVKSWYQDAGDFVEKTPAAIYNPIRLSGRKVLVPELLLNDESLIKVDYNKKQNFVKIKTGAETKYINASLKSGIPGKTIEDFKIKDALYLQPVTLQKNKNKHFYMLIKIPENSPAGLYKGKILLQAAGKDIFNIELAIKVLPFNLPASESISSIYYYPPNEKYYRDKRLAQYRIEWQNMRDHGITNIMYPFDIKHDKDFIIPELLKQEAGKRLFYRGERFGNPQSTPELDKITAKVSEIVKFFKRYGIENVYFYGIDEAKGEKLTSQIPAWKAIHKGGGKVFVSGFMTDKRFKGNFELVGDFQDLIVSWGYPDKKESAKWHSKKHSILSYGNPQGGVETPDTYRRNYGILLWQKDYDGAMNYIYHWGDGQRFVKLDFPSVWNDFCRSGKDNYKQHNMVYPTSAGVVDTLQWEGYREAITDIRYLQYLENLISKSDESLPASKKAKEFLKSLKQSDINVSNADLDQIRENIINHILSLAN